MSQLATIDLDAQSAREKAAFELLQRQATMFSTSSLVPKDFQGSVANCAIGLDVAKRLGASPFMVLQNIDIIHGRPSFRATFLIAMVNASGRFSPLQFRMEGAVGGPDRSCVAWARDLDSKDIIEGPPITMAMAKAEGWSTKTGSKWLTMPELMLRYRAAAFFARLYAPDVTLGMQTAEELQDLPIREVTPGRTLDFDPAATAPLAPAIEAAAEVVRESSHSDDFNLDASEPSPRERFGMALNEHDMTAGTALEIFGRVCRKAKGFAKLADVPDAAINEALADFETFKGL